MCRLKPRLLRCPAAHPARPDWAAVKGAVAEGDIRKSPRARSREEAPQRPSSAPATCRRDCQLCAGSGWHPVTLVRHDRAENAVERCPNAAPSSWASPAGAARRQDAAAEGRGAMIPGQILDETPPWPQHHQPAARSVPRHPAELAEGDPLETGGAMDTRLEIPGARNQRLPTHGFHGLRIELNGNRYPNCMASHPDLAQYAAFDQAKLRAARAAPACLTSHAWRSPSRDGCSDACVQGAAAGALGQPLQSPPPSTYNSGETQAFVECGLHPLGKTAGRRRLLSVGTSLRHSRPGIESRAGTATISGPSRWMCWLLPASSATTAM